MSRSTTTVEPGRPVRLDEFDPAGDGAAGKKSALAETRDNVKVLADLGYRLYAEHRRALLLVLQGMDTAGKDGTIRKVMQGFNPQSCRVSSFKVPTPEELDHDFLWRIHKQVPRRGEVGIFNRSHYEDVVIVRVHGLVPEQEWRLRYDHINDFERLLTEAGTTVVKIFLHISKDEQRKRLQARLDNPSKRWKFNRRDLDERKLWDDYQQAYQDAITRTNLGHAPWHIVPADRKWHRNLIVSRILRNTLEQMDPRFPPPAEDLDGLVVE
ncbi:MAG: polyphosphate kinase 2 family protein [Pirellulales bacterium]